MQLTEHIHLIGSGRVGFDLTNEFDCHVYLVADGDDAAPVDAPGHLVLVLAGGDAGVALDAAVAVAEEFEPRHGQALRIWQRVTLVSCMKVTGS